MQLLHFDLKKSNDLNTFITFWSQLYSYANEEDYSNAISKKEFTTNDLKELFKWKNGMELSAKKQKSVEDKILLAKFLIFKLFFINPFF